MYSFQCINNISLITMYTTTIKSILSLSKVNYLNSDGVIIFYQNSNFKKNQQVQGKIIK